LSFLLLLFSGCEKEEENEDDETNNTENNEASNQNPFLGKWACYCDMTYYSAFYTFYDNGTCYIEDLPADLQFTVTYSYNQSNSQLVLAGFVNSVSWVSPTQFRLEDEMLYKVN
jgi:hypothetical protein